MDADQTVECQAAHRVSDLGAHVAALRDVPGVTEAPHELVPGLSDADGAPAEFGRLVGEAVAGDGRQHEVERVLSASAVRGRVGEWADGLEQLDDRARPAVRHDQRQRVLVRRLHVDEVDVQPVDLGLELRQRVQSRLAPAPVVFGRPVAGELLHRRQLHTLRPIGDEFLGRPASRIDAAAQFFDLALRNFDSERADAVLCARRGVTHDRVLPFASLGALSIVECRDVEANIPRERRAWPEKARSGLCRPHRPDPRRPGRDRRRAAARQRRRASSAAEARIRFARGVNSTENSIAVPILVHLHDRERRAGTGWAHQARGPGLVAPALVHLGSVSRRRSACRSRTRRALGWKRRGW